MGCYFCYRICFEGGNKVNVVEAPLQNFVSDGFAPTPAGDVRLIKCIGDATLDSHSSNGGFSSKDRVDYVAGGEVYLSFFLFSPFLLSFLILLVLDYRPILSLKKRKMHSILSRL